MCVCVCVCVCVCLYVCVCVCVCMCVIDLPTRGSEQSSNPGDRSDLGSPDPYLRRVNWGKYAEGKGA